MPIDDDGDRGKIWIFVSSWFRWSVGALSCWFFTIRSFSKTYFLFLSSRTHSHILTLLLYALSCTTIGNSGKLSDSSGKNLMTTDRLSQVLLLASLAYCPVSHCSSNVKVTTGRSDRQTSNRASHCLVLLSSCLQTFLILNRKWSQSTVTCDGRTIPCEKIESIQCSTT